MKPELKTVPQTEFAEKMTITPTVAAQMLEGHENYRSLLGNRVALYAEDMKHGRWDDNGQPILIDEDGNIIDGQHRLHACIKSRCPFTTWVISGIPASKVDTIDTGRPRSLRDILERRQLPKADLVAAALPFVYNWEKAKCLVRDAATHPSRKSLLECLARHPLLIGYCQHHKALRDLGLTESFTSALRYVLVVSSNEEVAYQFLGELAVGDLLNERSPVFQLRKRLIRDVLTSASKLTKRTKIALVTKAWNSWLAGQETLQLKWTSTGPGAEPLPPVLTQAEATDSDQAA